MSCGTPTKRLSLPRSSRTLWRIEAPGCVIELSPDGSGGTVVEVIADGNRFADQGDMRANVYAYRAGKPLPGIERCSGVRACVSPVVKR